MNKCGWLLVIAHKKMTKPRLPWTLTAERMPNRSEKCFVCQWLSTDLFHCSIPHHPCTKIKRDLQMRKGYKMSLFKLWMKYILLKGTLLNYQTNKYFSRPLMVKKDYWNCWMKECKTGRVLFYLHPCFPFPFYDANVCQK